MGDGSGCTAWVKADTIDLGTGNASDVVRSNSIYARTSTFSANVGIATSPQGVFYRLTSSERYKVQIKPAQFDTETVLALAPVTYYDRGQVDAQDGTVAGLSQQLGLIAEQVHAIPGIGPLLTELDADGRPESVNYDRVGVATLVVVRDLVARVSALEANAS